MCVIRMLSVVSSDRLVAHVPVVREVLEGAALGLRDEESGKDTCKHESGIDLHDMIEPWVGILSSRTACTKWCNGSLSDDAANFAGSGGDTVGRRSVASWETLSWNNERSCVGSPVEKQLNQDVKSQLTVGCDLVVGKSPDDEKDGKHGEADQLKWFTANGINGSDSEPVSRNGTSANQDTVTGSEIVQLVVDVGTSTISDSLKNGRRVQTKTIKGNLCN